MDRRWRDRPGRRRRPGTCARAAGAGIRRLDPAEPEAAQARRDPRAGIGLGSPGDRPAPHPVGGAIPVRDAHQQSPRTLSVRGRGRRRDRPHPQGGPRRELAEQRRCAGLDVQAAAGREVAARAAAQRPRARRRRREVLLRGLCQGGRAGLHVPGDRGDRDARPVHPARASQDAQHALRPQRRRAGHHHLRARGARGRRRSEEAPDRHRALRAQGAHPQGAGGSRAEPGLLRQGPPVRRRVRHPLGARFGDPARGVPHGAERHPLGGGRVGSRSDPQDEPVLGHPGNQEHARPVGLALAQDRAPFNDLRVRRAISMAIDRQKQVDTVFEGHGMLGWESRTSTIRTSRRRPRSSDPGGSSARRRRSGSSPRLVIPTASRRRSSTTSTTRR